MVYMWLADHGTHAAIWPWYICDLASPQFWYIVFLFHLSGERYQGEPLYVFQNPLLDPMNPDDVSWWAQGASPGPSSCPRPPWHHYRKSAKHLEEAQISSDMFLPFIRKIVKRPCHKIPARKVSSPWVPWLEAGSTVECQSIFLWENLLFSKPLSLCPETASSNFAYEAAVKKWLGEKKKKRVNTAAASLQEKEIGFIT